MGGASTLRRVHCSVHGIRVKTIVFSSQKDFA